jgi:DNA-binding Xre family transcriptional regulator
MKINSLKIRLLMAEKGLTQTALSERCGIAGQNVSAMLARGSCSDISLVRIANALGVSAQEIMKEVQ